MNFCLILHFFDKFDKKIRDLKTHLLINSILYNKISKKLYNKQSKLKNYKLSLKKFQK